MFEPSKIYTETNLSADPPELLDNHLEAFIKCNENFEAIATEFDTYSTESIQDTVGAMFSGNTESTVSLTYDDASGKINASVSLGTGATDVCAGNDSRLSDARTALSHAHTESDISDLGDYADSNHTHSYASSTHASGHLSGQSDEIDGDKLDIDFSPSNYTAETVENVTDSTAQLTSHLQGIDTAIGTSSGITTRKAIAMAMVFS